MDTPQLDGNDTVDSRAIDFMEEVNMEHTANIEVKSAPTITHFLKFLGIYY
jgi:hypothetical protein